MAIFNEEFLQENLSKKVLQGAADRYEKAKLDKEEALHREELASNAAKHARNANELRNASDERDKQSSAANSELKKENKEFKTLNKYGHFYPAHGDSSKNVVDRIGKKESGEAAERARIAERKQSKAAMMKDLQGPTGNTKDLSKKEPGENLKKQEEKKAAAKNESAIFGRSFLESYFGDYEEYITESLTDNEAERKAAGKKIKASLDKWLKAYVKSYKESHPTFSSKLHASKYEKAMADASADIGFSVNDKDFVKGNSDEIQFKIYSKYSWLQIPIGILSALLCGYVTVVTGIKDTDRAAMNNHVKAKKGDIEKFLSDETGYDCTIKMGDKNKTVIVTCKDK